MLVMRATPIVILAAALGLTLPAHPLRAQEEAPAAAPAVQNLPAISVAEVTLRRMADRVITSGLVTAVEEVQVAPLIEGQPLEALLADVGDVVEQDQVLAVLSKSTLELQETEAVASLASARAGIAQGEAQMIEAEAAEAEAKRVAERTAKLLQQGTAPQAQLDNATSAATSATARTMVAKEGLEAARAQLALAEARLDNIRLQLSRTEVKAPVAGKIIARNAKLGAVATAAGEPMFVIVRDGALELRADVAEAEVLRLAEDQPARLRAVGVAEALDGHVRLVEPTINPTTRLGRARIAIDDEAALRAGMFIEAEITVAEREGLAVPLTALATGADGISVLRVTDGLVERVPVKVGIREGAFVEIVDGLSAGDQVVMKAGAFVRAGDRINPVLAAGNTN
jgi:HlyD family secretion protein